MFAHEVVARAAIVGVVQVLRQILLGRRCIVLREAGGGPVEAVGKSVNLRAGAVVRFANQLAWMPVEPGMVAASGTRRGSMEKAKLRAAFAARAAFAGRVNDDIVGGPDRTRSKGGEGYENGGEPKVLGLHVRNPFRLEDGIQCSGRGLPCKPYLMFFAAHGKTLRTAPQQSDCHSGCTEEICHADGRLDRVGR